MLEYNVIGHGPDAFQRPVAREDLIRLCQHAFGEDTIIESIQELRGGLFNNTYRINLQSLQPVILRVAPATNSHALGNDTTLMRQEHASQPFFAPIARLMPRTLLVDFTHQLIDRDYLFQSCMPGEQWELIKDKLTLVETTGLWYQLGTILKTIHSVKGRAFGPLSAGPQFPTCSAATIAGLTALIHSLVDDAHLAVNDLQTVLQLVEANSAIFDEITEPRLCHGDLWTLNLLVQRDTQEARISAVLDTDRTSWGDPLADWTIFLLALHTPAGSDAFWQAYGHPAQSQHTRFRTLVYHAKFVGAARFEHWRNHNHEKVRHSYTHLQALIAELCTLAHV